MSRLRHRSTLRHLARIALGLLAFNLAHADEASRVRAAVEPVIVPLMAQYDIPGMAIGVVVQGRPHVLNFGLASKESGQPVTNATLFEIGSLSKTLTATLGAYAEATGRLSLSDHVGKFVPELRGKPIDEANLLNLATYTAGGLPLQFPDSVAGQQDILDYYAGWTPTAPPGTQRRYSNPSLGLFGIAASNALGKKSFSDAMHLIVFPAFGMADTFIEVPGSASARYAWGYRGNGNGMPVRVNPGPLDGPTYGVKTTASDMLRFVQGNIDPTALQDDRMRRAVARTQIGFFRAGPFVQGLGWEQYAYPISREELLRGNGTDMVLGSQPVTDVDAANLGREPRLFNKTGSTNGFGAYALFVPSEKFGIVMLANRNYPGTARIEAALAVMRGLLATKQAP